jgi:chitin disaccharide deacetylase
LPARSLIVNADDFGQSAGVNRGVVATHESGIVTSASLMVRWPAAEDAARYGRTRPALSLGLHFDLGEWAFRQQTWVPLYQVADADDPAAVERELSRQLAQFAELVGRPPTHLDSHQHVHRQEPVRTAMLRAAAALAVPLRHFSSEIHYRGDFYGQTGKGEPYPAAITVEALLDLLRQLPPGTTELGCHPAALDDLDSMYRLERLQERDVLCDLRLRAAIDQQDIALRSFHPLNGGPGPR